MDIFAKLFRKPLSQPDIEPIYKSDNGIVDYNAKFDRADKVTFESIGQTTYGSGQPPQLYDNALTAFKSYPLVYSCITAISDSIAGLNIKVYQVNGAKREEVPDHPMYQIFRNPNPYQGSFEFLERLAQYLETTGNVFISKEKVAGTYELYIQPSKYIAIIPDPKKRVKEYHYNVNGNIIKYKPEEVIHIKFNDVNDEYYGFVPLTAASELIKFEKSRLAFINAYFANGAIPVGVLETEQVMSENILRKLRNEWHNIHQGTANAHKIAILQGGLKYQAITSPIKELDFSGLRNLSKEEILALFKVPASILGNQDGTGSSEGKDAITAFWRLVIIPRLKRIESAINRGLKDDVLGKGQYEIAFDLSDIAALQDSKVDISKYIQTMISSSVFTPNDGRRMVGLPPVPDEFADKLYISNANFGNQLIPSDAIGTQPQANNNTKPTAKPNAATPKPAATTPTKPKKSTEIDSEDNIYTNLKIIQK